MQSSVAFAGKSSHLALNGRAITLLAAVIAGIYLGASTISEIDPFYRNGQTRSSEGSYTIDGWRGADAVRPPVSAPPEAPMRNFGMAWAPTRPRDYPAYPIDSVAYAPDPEPSDADPEDCADCSGFVEPVPEAVTASPGERDGEEASDELVSAPSDDF